MQWQNVGRKFVPWQYYRRCFLVHSSPTPQGWGYTVFGQVIDGMDVVNQIKGVPTGRFGYHADVPNEPIVINSAKVINQ